MIGFIFLISFCRLCFMLISQYQKKTRELIILEKKLQLKLNMCGINNLIPKINVVYGNEWNAGNLSYHLKSRPVWEGFIEREKLRSIERLYVLLIMSVLVQNSYEKIYNFNSNL